MSSQFAQTAISQLPKEQQRETLNNPKKLMFALGLRKLATLESIRDSITDAKAINTLAKPRNLSLTRKAEQASQ
jgi:hypothetical protein